LFKDKEQSTTTTKLLVLRDYIEAIDNILYAKDGDY